MAVIEGTLLDEGGAVYNVKAYGLLGNSDPADGPKLKTMLNAVPANSTILFPPDTYVLGQWGTAYEVTKRLKFVGSGPGVVLQGPGHTYDFLKLKADVEVEGIGFTNWRTVLDGQGSEIQEDSSFDPRILNEVRATRCQAYNLRYFISWTVTPPPPGTVVPEPDPDVEPDPAVRRLVVEDCHFQGITHGVMYISVNVTETIVRNNVVLDCARYVCHLLKGEGERGRGRLLFEGNYVRGLTQGIFEGDDAVARVVQASVERAELINNYVRDVSTLGNTANPVQAGSNFAYITSSRLYVAGNLCWDVGSPGTVSSIIHEKNYAAFGAQIIGNSFIQRDDNLSTADAIQLTGQNVLVDGVFTTGLRGSAVATDQVKGGTISNVVMHAHRGHTGILILGGRDIHVDGPHLRGHVNTLSTTGQPRGIVIQGRSDPVTTDPTINDVSNIRITNPLIRDVKTPDVQGGMGINVWVKSGTMRQIAIHGGSVAGCDRGIELSASAGATLEDVEILGTDLRNNRVPIANSTTPGTLIVRDSRGYRTDNQGLAQITAGGTAATVQHGLARAPAPGGVSVTPAGSLGNAARFWVDSVTLTSFAIRTDAAAGVVVPFAWRAVAEEL